MTMVLTVVVGGSALATQHSKLLPSLGTPTSDPGGSAWSGSPTISKVGDLYTDPEGDLWIDDGEQFIEFVWNAETRQYEYGTLYVYFDPGTFPWDYNFTSNIPGVTSGTAEVDD
jgi:hypothetical protein